MSRLGTDTQGVWYGDLRLDSLQLYFLTGVLANYAGLHNVNNIILLAFILVTIFSPQPKILRLSPLLRLYGLMTLLSLFNPHSPYGTPRLLA